MCKLLKAQDAAGNRMESHNLVEAVSARPVQMLFSPESKHLVVTGACIYARRSCLHAPYPNACLISSCFRILFHHSVGMVRVRPSLSHLTARLASVKP